MEEDKQWFDTNLPKDSEYEENVFLKFDFQPSNTSRKKVFEKITNIIGEKIEVNRGCQYQQTHFTIVTLMVILLYQKKCKICT